ncbi:MAG TPA: methyltransferase domain-containing protein [Trueperaceae bacterium]
MLLERATRLRERMDDPACDPRQLRNTYAQFALVNRWVSGWRRVFERLLAPRLFAGATLLDVGCGGADVTRSLLRWSRQLGEPLLVTAIDPDPRALEFARSRSRPGEIEFVQATAEELARAGRRFDFVVSNHLLHHLEERELPAFLDACGRLGGRLVVHNDLRRHPVALLGFALTWPIFSDSFIVGDGLRSIRRSYAPSELRAVLPDGWRHETLAPFRNLVVLER